MIDERWQHVLQSTVGGPQVDLAAVRVEARRGLRRLVATRLTSIAVVAVLLLGGGLSAALAPDPDGAVAVPDVVGMPVAEAVIVLAEAGFEVEARLVENDRAAAGTVVAQDPDGGARVTPGLDVTIHVATVGSDQNDGPTDEDRDDDDGQVTVPDVVNRSLEDALAALTSVGLEVDVRRVETDEAPANTVLTQDPAGGSKVDAGATVGLTVAQPPPTQTNPIAWILSLGPGAPVGPPEFVAYDLLLAGRCAELAERIDSDGDQAINLQDPGHTLYRGTAAACLAALHGQGQEWARAQAALAAVTGRAATCMDVATLALLQRLVEAHQGDPDGAFERAAGGPSEAAPCPTIARLDPPRAVAGVPSEVTIHGANFERVTGVTIYYDDVFSEELPFERRDASTLVVLVRPDQLGPACIVVLEDDNWNAAGAVFQVDPRDAITDEGTTDDAGPDPGQTPDTDAGPSSCPPPSE